MEEKNDEKKLLVVSQLPTTSLREVNDEEGNVYECLTVEEALKEVLEKVRNIEKQVS